MLTRAFTNTWSPSLGLKLKRELLPRNIAQRTCARESFNEKYQCPEAGHGEVRDFLLPPKYCPSPFQLRHEPLGLNGRQ